MIQAYIDRFLDAKPMLIAQFSEKHPEDYKAIVHAVITAISKDEYDDPSPERIHQIDDGNCQGTLVFVVAAGGYQPDDYWYCRISYGSCSGCDTLEGIRKYSEEKPTEEQVSDYMTLALHVVQRLKKMDGDCA